MKIGEYNRLKVSRTVDFGVYLTDGEGSPDVLMPSKYIEKPLKEGDEVDVFVYRDSDDRPVAVTEHPFATVGQFAFLQVAAVNRVGAFLDWGLPKDLLVPFREQKARMREGGIYPVYVYLDHETGRVAATARIEKYLDNVYPELKPGDSVEALVLRHTDTGYACIVNNLHSGMLYDNELFRNLEIGQTVEASVHRVRPDGKIDLTLGGNARQRSRSLADAIADRIAAEGSLAVSEKSSPDAIKEAFACSKKDFKKAVGHLLKTGKIEIKSDGTIVCASK